MILEYLDTVVAQSFHEPALWFMKKTGLNTFAQATVVCLVGFFSLVTFCILSFGTKEVGFVAICILCFIGVYLTTQIDSFLKTEEELNKAIRSKGAYYLFDRHVTRFIFLILLIPSFLLAFALVGKIPFVLFLFITFWAGFISRYLAICDIYRDSLEE